MGTVINFDFCENPTYMITRALNNPFILKHGMQRYWKSGQGFDCETTITPRKYAFVYIWQFAINEYTFYGRSCKSFFEFAKILDKIAVKQYYKNHKSKPKAFPQLLIYIANMGYEWAFFKTVFNKLGIRKIFAKKRRQPLSIKVGNCLEFRECLGLWGKSLKKIAENYTKTQKLKGDLLFKDENGNDIQRNSKTVLTQKELGYCVNDVQILQELCFVTFERFKGINIPYTQTGIIRNDVKQRMQSKGNLVFESIKKDIKRLYPHTEKEYNICLHLLFCGGLTHTNFKYARKKLKGVTCADLTSDYPACMAHNTFPAGTLYGNGTFEDMQNNKHWFALCEFTNVKSLYGHTTISEHKCVKIKSPTFDNGRVYSAKLLKVYLNEVDFDNFCLMYDFDTCAFSDIHYFSMSKPIPQELFDVMFYHYRRKAQLKKEGKTNTIEYIESKQIVNGCFGFCATRIYLKDVNLVNGDLKEERTTKSYEELTKDIWLNPFIAIYTTSYARKILCEIISRFPECIVQYDTDSIYFLENHEQAAGLKKYIAEYNAEITEKNKAIFDSDLYYDLGTWDIEGKSEYFKALGAKRYLKQTEGKIKLVTAGCKAQSFIDYCQANNLDYWETFDKDMVIPANNSLKTTLRYYDKKDKPYTDTITDYQGHTQEVEIDTCAVITEIPFALNMQKYLDFLEYMKRECDTL